MTSSFGIKAAVTNPNDPSLRYPYQVSIEACPSQFLKTLETLKQMGISTTYFELSFKTISQIELFTRVLNRQEDEQRVANELKTTYFHNIRGKVKRTQMTRNQEFVTMKKMKFNSAYHVTLFMKFYDDRIKQLENQYRYTLVSGVDGHLHVYLNDDDTISSMFINEIRDMKKRLQFLEIKDMTLCQKFVYSQQLGKQLNKIGVFNQIWYRGKQSTIIFYSEKQTLFKMKQLVNAITKYHLTILKLQDQSVPFLINYLLFGLLKKSIYPDIMRLRAIEYLQVEFTENKVGIVLHDKHELFSPQIVEELMERMKNYLLFTVRAKDARKFFNLLKKQCSSDQSIIFCYSKKTVCVCINVQKIKSYSDLKKIFGQMPHAVNQDSQITFNWFHIQDPSLKDYCKHLSQRILLILSASQFHVENFEKLMHNKALKCILRLKNISRDLKILSERVGETIVNVIKTWHLKDSTKEKVQFEFGAPRINAQHQNTSEHSDEEEDEQNQQNDTFDESEDEDIDLDEEKENQNIEEKQQKNQSPQNIIKVNQVIAPKPVKKGFHNENLFTAELINYFTNQKEPKLFKPEEKNVDQWKEEKLWRKAEQLLLNEVNIMARIKHISLNEIHSQRVKQAKQQLTAEREQSELVFHEFISYSMTMYESPYYQSSQEKVISKFEDLKVGQKWIICYEKEIEEKMISYPVCSVEVLKRM